MFALRDFRYRNQETGQAVEVRAGQEVNPDLLAAHKCDVAKLERTKFVRRAEAPTDVARHGERLGEPPKRPRGRPRKQPS